MQWLGRVSYSWYLWHWPLIVFTVALLDDESSTARTMGALLALPVAAAAYHWFETPIRFSTILLRSPRSTTIAGVGLTVMTVVAALVCGQVAEWQLTSEPTASINEARTAHRSAACPDERTSEMGAEYCVLGDESGAKTVMLVGDSHARQWMTAFGEAAADIDARVVVRWKSVCPSIDVDATSFEGVPAGASCSPL